MLIDHGFNASRQYYNKFLMDHSRVMNNKKKTSQCVQIIIIVMSKVIRDDLVKSKAIQNTKFSMSKTSVIQPAQLLTDNTFRDSLLLQ